MECIFIVFSAHFCQPELPISFYHYKKRSFCFILICCCTEKAGDAQKAPGAWSRSSDSFLHKTHVMWILSVRQRTLIGLRGKNSRGWINEDTVGTTCHRTCCAFILWTQTYTLIDHRLLSGWSPLSGDETYHWLTVMRNSPSFTEKRQLDCIYISSGAGTIVLTSHSLCYYECRHLRISGESFRPVKMIITFFSISQTCVDDLFDCY